MIQHDVSRLYVILKRRSQENHEIWDEILDLNNHLCTEHN